MTSKAKFESRLASPAARWAVAVGVIALALAFALGWLGIVKTGGREAQSTTSSLRSEQVGELAGLLTRSGTYADGAQADVIITPPGFYRMANRSREAADYGADKFVVFVANEHAVTSDLPARFAPVLRIDGKSLFVPSETRVIADALHHRSTVVIYRDVPAQVLAEDHTLELLLPPTTSGVRTALEWSGPVDVPENASAPALTLPMLLTLSAGLLAAISPCLLQLTAFYLPTLAGVTMDRTEGQRELTRADQRRVMTTAGVFVLGFTVPYTLGGAAIGGIGQWLAQSGLLDSRGPIAIGAGIVMIGMAIMVAYRARAPLVCRMPMPGAIKRSQRLPVVETFLSGFAIATGCLACFGGAILGVLLVYTGMLGSWWLGGVSMFVFSLGVAIPFLLAAFSISWILPIAERLQRFAPAIGLVSAAIMLFFGLVMATGNYHEVSGWLARNLPLG